MAHVAHAPRPLAAVAPDLTLPPGLTRLVMQLLKKQPKDRPSSAADVLEALAHLGEAEALPVGETAPAGGPLRPREPTGEEDTVAAGADVVSAHDAATIAPPSVDPPSPAAAAPARGFHIGWLAAAFILSVLVLAVIHAADLLPSKGPKTTTPPERTSRPVEAPAVEAAPAPDLRRRAATADRRDEVALETAAKPVAEKPKPVAEKPKPKPKPVAETRKPKPKPKPKPVAENPKPVAENPKPVTKRPKPEAVDVAPVRPSRDGTTKDRARGAFDELDDF